MKSSHIFWTLIVVSVSAVHDFAHRLIYNCVSLHVYAFLVPCIEFISLYQSNN